MTSWQQMPAAQYHKADALSSGKMIAFANGGPSAMFSTRRESTAMSIGTAIHTALNEPHLLQDIRIIEGSGTRRALRAAAQWGHVPDVVALSVEQAELCRDAALSAAMAVADVASEASDLWAEHVGLWVECGLQQKCRPDWLLRLPAGLVSYDWKTTDDVSPKAWRRKSRAYRLDLQAAHYTAGILAVFHGITDAHTLTPRELGDLMPVWVFGEICTRPPHVVVFRKIGPERMCRALMERRALVEELARRVREGDWSDPRHGAYFDFDEE